MTRDERRKLMRFLRDSLHVIDDLLDELDKRSVQVGVSQRELDLISMWRPELEGEFARIDGKLWALRRGRQGLVPPSDEIVEKIEGLTEEVDELIGRDKTVNDIIALTTKVVSAVNESGLVKPA